jgi:Ca2+-binding RTX toxin-like protein
MRAGFLLPNAVGGTLVGVGAALAFTGGALASSVHVEPSGVVTYAAAAGEVNHATFVEPAGAHVLHITDTGAVITAGAGCVSVSDHEVDCSAELRDGLSVDTGDLNDFASLWGLGAPPTFSDPVRRVTGGDGGDELVGSTGGDQLDGGPGPDTLRGLRSVCPAGDPDFCTGWDELVGGAGDDRLFGGRNFDFLEGGEGADLLSGGGGHDVAVYGGPIASDDHGAVVVTLDDVADDGEPLEGDNVRSNVEDIDGTAGNDRLIGSDVRNRLRGYAGNDRLRGRAGRDFLEGGFGDDMLRGGGGHDTFWGDCLCGGYPRGRGTDVIVGGPGRDEAWGNGGPDTFWMRDAFADRIRGGAGSDRAQIDAVLDHVRGVESFF